MNTVYVDVLFLINFTVDYLSLYLTGKALRLPLSRIRLIMVATGGAVYALWALLLCEHYIVLIATAILVCLIGTHFAYPRQKFVSLLRNSFIFTAVCVTLGGLVSLLYRVLSHFLSGATMRDNGIKVLVFTLLTGVSSMLLAIGNHLLTDVRGTKAVTVSICINGKWGKFHLLVDSGNLVKEPVSGKRVIFLSQIAARKTFGDTFNSPGFCPERRRVITIDWGGEKRMLLSVFPDRLELDGSTLDAYVAVMPQEHIRQYDGVFPAALLT